MTIENTSDTKQAKALNKTDVIGSCGSKKHKHKWKVISFLRGLYSRELECEICKRRVLI